MPATFARMGQPDVSALLYHGLRTRPQLHVDALYACKDADMFEQDLRTLVADFVPVSHDDIVAARENGRALPARAVTISFDDGFAECYTVVRPLLLKYRVPCTFFVITSTLDNRALMHRNQIALCLAALADKARDWQTDLDAVKHECGKSFNSLDELRFWANSLRYKDRHLIRRLCDALAVDVEAYLSLSRPYMSLEQVRQLHADGFTIGAHTVDHPEMAQLSADERRQQMATSCRFVSELTERARVPFAIPFNGLELARGELAHLREELGNVDLVYDTNNHMPDRNFIVNRIWCDTPKGAGARHSNLPALLRRAALYEPFRRIKRRLSGLPR
jgi:peptidoglycan/xylan/chitin deacetylase (PgdA/CDA1 family)